MESKSKKTLTVVALAAAVSLVGVSLWHSSSSIRGVKGTTEYSLSLNSGHRLDENGATTTDLGNKISFASSGFVSSEGKFGSLATGGYLINVTALTGLKTISASLESGSLRVYFGWESTSLSDPGITLTPTSSTYDFDSCAPTFVKLVASQDTSIVALNYCYSCLGSSSYSYTVGDASSWNITTADDSSVSYTSESSSAILMFNQAAFYGGTIEYDMAVTSSTYTYNVANGIVIGASGNNVTLGEGNYYVVGRSPWADYVAFSKNEGAFAWEDSNKISNAFPNLNTVYHVKFIWDRSAGALHYFLNGVYQCSTVLKNKFTGCHLGLYTDMPGVTFSKIVFTSSTADAPSSLCYTAGVASDWSITGSGDSMVYSALSGGKILMFNAASSASTYEFDLNVTSGSNTYWCGTGLVVGADSPYADYNYGKFVVVGRDDWGGFNTFAKDNGGFAWNDSSKVAGAFPNLNTVYHYKFVINRSAGTIAYYLNGTLSGTQTTSVSIAGNYWGLSADSAAVFSNLKAY